MALPPDLPTHFLRYFVMVAETGSYGAAAQKTHRSQPAISLAIKQLESMLGQALFEPAERTRLTAFGAACLPLAQEFLQCQSRTVDTLRRLSGNEFGKITLACVPTAATHLLPGVLTRFVEQYPGVDIALLDDNSRNIERMVAEEEVDFGICSHVSTDSRFAFEHIIRDRYGVVCHAGHPLASRTEISWAEISNMPLLGSAAHHQLKDFPDAPALAEPRIFISNMMSLLAMLDRGLGITVLAELAVPPYYAERLQFVPLSGPPITRRLGVLRLAKRSFSAPAGSLLAMIRAHIAATMPDLAVPAPA